MTVQIITGNCIDILPTLPEKSINCCVTSPPYWGLRDYGTATWEGGDADCDHILGTESPRSSRPLGKFHGGDDRYHLTPYKQTCGKCGAIRIDNQLGLEESPQEYVDKLVLIFREVRRVLRDDGTVWLNLGDSYSSSAAGNTDATFSKKQASNRGNALRRERSNISPDLKPKDLIGIPWRVAFALQADGWWLRSDIIWHKPNPMPESVTDRPTKAHEYVFLLSKSAQYWYDAEAIKEPAEGMDLGLLRGRNTGGATAGMVAWHAKSLKDRQDMGVDSRFTNPSGMKNKRSVWTIPSAPYPEAHFATYPPDLIKPMIMAGCPEGGMVLDPFAGSGTTGMVADRLGRNAILIELNPEYVKLADKRIKQDAGWFAKIEVI